MSFRGTGKSSPLWQKEVSGKTRIVRERNKIKQKFFQIRKGHNFSVLPGELHIFLCILSIVPWWWIWRQYFVIFHHLSHHFQGRSEFIVGEGGGFDSESMSKINTPPLGIPVKSKYPPWKSSQKKLVPPQIRQVLRCFFNVFFCDMIHETLCLKRVATCQGNVRKMSGRGDYLSGGACQFRGLDRYLKVQPPPLNMKSWNSSP